MMKGELSQQLLDQSNSKSFAENSSPSKSMVQYSIIQAMLELKMKEHSIQPGETINTSIIEESPQFLERGADYSSRLHDNENILFGKQKPSQRMSHVYPSYMSENSVQIDFDKIEMFEHTYPVDQILKIYKTNQNEGLSDQQVQERLQKYGENVITSKHASVSLKEICSLFSFVMILAIVLSIIGFLYDEKEKLAFLVEVISLMVVFFLTHSITYLSYLKKKKLVTQFNSLITNDEVFVIRNGLKQKISSAQLVRGDVIELNSFSKVPADCRIIESQQLSVDNFIFTGDCQPILLESEESNHKSILESRNVAFLGVGCVFGEGKAIVIRTGNQTILGKLAKQIEVPQIVSQLNLQVKRIIQVTTISIIIFIFITLIGWIIQEKNKNQYDVTFLINTVIIIILSNLPFTLMLILTFSKRKIGSLLQEQGILLQEIDMIEKLCSMNLLLINKECLLLEQQMPKKIILNNEIMNISNVKMHQNLLNCIYYSLYQEKYQVTESQNKFNIKYILRELIRNYEIEEFNIIEQRQFTSMERYSLTIVQHKIYKSQYIIYLMGTPEIISSKVNNYGSFEEMQFTKSYQKLAKKGYSLISFAELNLILDENFKFNLANTNEFNFNFNHLSHLGTIGFKLQIKPVIRTVLQKLQLSGIRVVLMTGDLPETAQYLAQESQLTKNSILVTGNELDDHEQKEANHQQNDQHDEESINTKLCTQLNTIYARINPAQKLMVISAYQKLGYQVGMIGFDTIDSPAMRKCDVSFAITRSDELAKQSSNFVLLKNNQCDLEQVLNAIGQCKRFSDNLIKQIKLCLSNKFGQFIPILLMLFAGIPLPLTSFGILYITLALEILVIGILYEYEEVDITIREPGNVQVFQKIQDLLRWIFTHGALAASSGLISYLVVMHYLGFESTSLVRIIYQNGYSSQKGNSDQFYSYNQSDQYLGNYNLMNISSSLKKNPFIQYQFYKHFDRATEFDLRNVFVEFNATSENWQTTFKTINSEICDTSHLCYSYLSLDLAQLGFIFGFIMWGWLHVFLGRTRVLSFRYQKATKQLFRCYCVSLIVVASLYLPYIIYYFPGKDIDFIAAIGMPCIPILILYCIFSEVTSRRKQKKLKLKL